MTQWLLPQAIHVLDLPAGARTSDEELMIVADRDGRIVVTKDADFVDSHLLRGQPAKLLLISTGNIANRELQALLIGWLPDITRAFQSANFIELGRGGVTVRG